MHDNVIRLYSAGELTAAGLAKAVSYGWITEAEYTELTGQAYVAPVNLKSELEEVIAL